MAKPPQGVNFTRLIWQLAAWTVLLAVGSIGIGAVIDGGPGALSGALGAVVTLIFCGTTATVMALTAHRTIAVQSAWLVGSWIIKTIALLGAAAAADTVTILNRPIFAVAVLVGVAGSLALDMRLVWRARVSPGD